MVRSTTAVLRAGMQRPQEMPISALVPGDIVYLSAGDMIPADVRVLTAKDLFVSQAMLTGRIHPGRETRRSAASRHRQHGPERVAQSCSIWKPPASWAPTW